jgi:hypothetical protein
VSRETLIDFSEPIQETGVGPASFRVTAAGNTLDTLVDLAQDRRSVRIFYKDRLPASTRVRVSVDGGSLRDDNGAAVDADGDGLPGGTGTIDFDTLTLTTLDGTVVCGKVLAAEQAGGQDVPLQGAVVSVDGREEILRDTTDAAGDFCLDPAPAGPFFVHIDGRTATNPKPAGAYYPFVGKRWESDLGTTTDIGNVYLPLVAGDALQPVSPTADTDVGLPASVVAQHPEFAGVKVTVKADSLFSEEGARGGKVGLALVPPERLPGPLPLGADPALVITVQSDLGTDFDRPAPACFPNLPSAPGQPAPPPGAKVGLVSFDHDVGDWVPGGSMTVTPDGSLACSDPGSGIREPGWHYIIDVAIHYFKLQVEFWIGAWKFVTGGFARQAVTELEQATNALKEEVARRGDVRDECAAWALAKARHDRVPAFQEYSDKSVDFYLELAKQRSGGKIQELIQVAQHLKPVLEDVVRTGEVSSETVAELNSSGANQIADILVDELAPAATNDRNMSDVVRGQVTYKVVTKIIEQLTLAEQAVAMLEQGVKLNEVADTVERDAKQLAEACMTRYGGGSPPPGGPDPVAELLDYLAELKQQLDAARASLEALDRSIKASDELATVISQLPPGGTSDPGRVAETRQKIENAIETIGDWSITPGPFLPPTPSSLPDELFEEADRPPEIPLRFGIFLPRPGLSEGECGTTADPNSFVIRTQTSQLGLVDAMIDADDCGEIAALDPVTGAVMRMPHSQGTASGTSRTYERRLAITPGSTALEVPNPDGVGMLDLDPDNDGLQDVGEAVVGTSRTDSDSDNDGIDDLAELRAGSDPMDGTPVRTGVIATVDTPGTAVDVDAASGLAAVADSASGVALFDADRAAAPVMIGRVDTPGDARGVALAGDRLAVADGAAGVAIVDVSDPPGARILTQTDLGGPVTRVAAAADVIYAVVGGSALAIVDSATGLEIDRVPMGAGLEDVALAGDRLYVASQGSKRVLRDFSTGLDELGRVADPAEAGFMRIQAGGGKAWIGHADPGARVGFRVLDASDPEAPVLVGEPPAPQAGVHDIAVNGSGLVVTAANFANQPRRVVALYDGSDPTDVTRFLTAFPTPGEATAVALFGGLAYVADGDAGLQVVNYRPFDANGVAPSVTLQTSGAEATEGRSFRMTASVADDVQVGAVEFMVDGTVVATDGSFPFEHRFLAPLRSEATSMTLRARAIDTGGNAALSSEVVVPIVADASPPRVRRSSPSENRSVVPGTRVAVSVVFDEPVDRATVTADRLQVIAPGPDREPGTADDVPLTGGAISVREGNFAAVITLPGPLTFVGRHRIVVGPGIADAAGNAMSASVTRTFRVSQSQLAPGGSVLFEGEIEAAGAVDEYALAAEAGQRVFLDIEALGVNCGFLDLLVTIEAPGGTPVLDDHLMRFCADRGGVVLPVDGTYTVRVRPAAPDELGAYRFRLHDVPEPDEGPILLDELVAPGQPFSGAGTIEAPGRSDVYRLAGQPGMRVFVDVESVQGGCAFAGDLGWELRRPDGSVFVPFRALSFCFDRGPLTLDAAGTWTFEVRPREHRDDVGPYRLRIRSVPAPDVASLTLNQPVSGEVERPAAADEWTFSAQSGDRVFVDIRSVRGSCAFTSDLGWELLRPDGSAFGPFEIFSVCIDRGPLTLDASGIWRLVARAPEDGDGTGPYELAVHSVPAPQTFPMAIGTEVGPGQPAPGAGEIETPGVEDRYTFEGTAGQRVFVDIRSVRGTCAFAGDLGWELLRPDGTPLSPYQIFSICLDEGPITLDVTGTWRLTVRAPPNDDGTGTYTLAVLNVPEPQTFPIAVGTEVGPGQPAAGAGEIESPGAEDRYTFTGAAGQQLTIDVISVRGSCAFTGDLGTELRRPDGTVLAAYQTFSVCVDRNVTLDAAGTWTLVARAPVNDAGVGTYRLAVVAAAGGVAPTAAGRGGSALPAPAAATAPVTWLLASAHRSSASVPAKGGGDLPADPAGGARAVVARWLDEGFAAVRRRALNPPRAARVFALLAVAQNDAAVAAGSRSQAIDAAIETASRDLLRGLFPDDAARFDAVRTGPRPKKSAAGRRAAKAVLARAKTDGSTAVWPGPIPETDGGWQPTPPMFAWPSEPLAGTWKTWNTRTGRAIPVAQPPELGSEELAAEMREIYALSKQLTPKQRRMVLYWEGRRGTITPSGLWMQIAFDLLRRERASARQSARVLATLATAQADAMIAAWHVKYRWWTVRPVTEIRRTIDPEWLPLVRTPNFPGYVSGHSTTSAAAATVLGAFLPSRRERMSALAREAGLSRLLGGIHIRSDDEAGAKLGAAVGRAALRHAAAR